MPSTVTTIIGLALLFYTIGVWSERFQGRLRAWHLVFFWMGLVCDTWGTGLMFDYVGGMSFDIHGITGVIAIVLMMVHAVWATVVLVRKDERWLTRFHRLSIAVWVVWLVPYLSPMVIAIGT